MTFDDLQKTIGIPFTNQDLLRTAFFHRSYLNEAKNITQSNERLEFLGDAVLSFLTSSFLYQRFPEYPEGILTNIRSSLVKTKSLSQVAKTLALGDLLYLSRGEEESGGRANPSLLADTFEALLGALFLDQGVEAAKQFLAQYVFPKVTEIIEKRAYIDFKSLLQEIVQEKERVSPTYRVVKSQGPDHAKTFWIEAIVGESAIGSGMGKSKQEAEQQAASNALEKMGKI
ncbi:MAG: Ribonuclease 3 [Microgenomates group bacterium GW2011_GWA2_47_8]|nr:MAG: Ribonuclease 3 [Microgenomates group bacterium GW2011_GWA2_47_8]